MSTTVNTDMYQYIDEFFKAKYILSIVCVIASIFILYMAFSKKKSYSDDYTNKPKHGGFLQTIVFLIILFLIINAILLFFKINIFLSFKNFYKKEINLITGNTGSTGSTGSTGYIPKSTSQVFNIPGNNYTYDDAVELCKAYGAEIANYSQLENAYQEGANWCNYGWSDDQLALFPIQKTTYEKLQKIKGHENDCGRPGINGGFMANPYNKYGVNCYGKKPLINKEEQTLMKINPTEDTEINKKVDYWKGQIPNILISPFNSDTWSKI